MKGDTISRTAAVELAMCYCPDDDGTCSKSGENLRDLLDDLENLPSAPPMSYRMGYQAGYAAALREQRSCEGCKNEYVGMDFICNHCFRNVGDRYEPKEKPGNGKA